MESTNGALPDTAKPRQHWGRRVLLVLLVGLAIRVGGLVGAVIVGAGFYWMERWPTAQVAAGCLLLPVLLFLGILAKPASAPARTAQIAPPAPIARTVEPVAPAQSIPDSRPVPPPGFTYDPAPIAVRSGPEWEGAVAEFIGHHELALARGHNGQLVRDQIDRLDDGHVSNYTLLERAYNAATSNREWSNN